MNNHRPAGLAVALALCACVDPGARPPVEAASAAAPPRAITPPPAPPPARAAPDVRATIVPARPAPAAAPPAPVAAQARGGDVSLNFPGVEVSEVARAVLGGILGLQYSVRAGVSTPVTLVTQRPVARGDVLRLFEEALRAANLALVPQGGAYAITPLDQARAGAPLVTGGTTPGFASESIPLEFVSADELKKLLDPILPGVVTAADAQRNILTVAGTTGQRASVRDLVRQFDVNWLRGVSFALFVPRRTDARLIAPELDKLLNTPGAPTNGLVRLIAMERLNGILAITGQRQYLDDVRRWIDILDREGESAQARLFVYRVQNGRSGDLARVLITALGAGGSVDSGQPAGFDAIGTGRQIGETRGQGDPFGVRRNGPGGTQRGELTGATNEIGSLNANAATAAQRLALPAQGLRQAEAAAAARGDINATITSDEANNAILVYGTPREYAVIEDALRQLDVPPSQVMIEAAISEVTLTDALRYGVQGIFDVRNGQLAITDATGAGGQGIGRITDTRPEIPGTFVTRLAGFSFLLANRDITAILNALESLTKVNVISAPKLMVINNQTASLQVGNQVPIASASSVSTIDTEAPIRNEIEYRDTGVILKITPRVNAGGLVLLDIAQEVSAVSNTATVAGIQSPTFSTRRIATSIAVQDGETIALGGLIQDSRARGRSGVPFLSRIPLIGALFGTRTTSTDRTELLILIRPRVVRGVDDGRAITDELRAKLQATRPLRAQDTLP